MGQVISMDKDLKLRQELDEMKVEDMNVLGCALLICDILKRQIIARDVDFFRSKDAEYYLNILPDRFIKNILYIDSAEYYDSREVCGRIVHNILSGFYSRKGYLKEDT